MNIAKNMLTCVLGALALQPVSAKDLTLVVGTYTGGSSKGIYTFKFNDRTGDATPLSMLEVENASFVKKGVKPGLLYAVSEKSDATAAIHAIRLDERTGDMQLLNSQPTHGADPCQIATNGKVVTTANYTGGTLSVFPIHADGTLQPMAQQFAGTTAATDVPNQATPHVHCVLFTSDGRRALASDFSANRLLRFRVQTDGSLQPEGVAATMSRNTAPRHFTWSRKALYVIGEVSGAVSVFKWGEGEMQRIQEIRSDSVGGHGGADIHLSRDGRFLYVSNRLKADGISIFSVDRKDGRLKKTGYRLTGIHPRHFNITPNGRFLLCACRDSNKIQVFRIDRKTGLLTDTGKDIHVDKAVCVEF